MNLQWQLLQANRVKYLTILYSKSYNTGFAQSCSLLVKTFAETFEYAHAYSNVSVMMPPTVHHSCGVRLGCVQIREMRRSRALRRSGSRAIYVLRVNCTRAALAKCARFAFPTTPTLSFCLWREKRARVANIMRSLHEMLLQRRSEHITCSACEWRASCATAAHSSDSYAPDIRFLCSRAIRARIMFRESRNTRNSLVTFSLRANFRRVREGNGAANFWYGDVYGWSTKKWELSFFLVTSSICKSSPSKQHRSSKGKWKSCIYILL